MAISHEQTKLPINFSPLRRSVLEDLGNAARNLFCRYSVLGNEPSVEDFFVTRLIADLGYQDSQIATQKTLEELAVGRGRRKERYKPDFALR